MQGITPTGWFQVAETESRWFFITPEGDPFFSIGATHANDCIQKDELNLFHTRYQGNEALLSAFLLERFEQWGYNSAGYGALPSMREQLPYVAIARTLGPRSHSAGPNSEYADLFDPAIQAELRQRIHDSIKPHLDKQNCLGYVFRDLPLWGTTPQRGKPTYMDFIRALPEEAPGKQAYSSFIGNESKPLSATHTVDSILRSENNGELTKLTPSSQASDEAFLNILADLYYRLTTEAIREIDPHHLILGDRFMTQSSRTPDSILVTAARYVDALSFQPMGTQSLVSGYLDQVHEITGKPTLLADVNCVLQRPARDQTDTRDYQKNVADHTRRFYLDAASSPACIGIHRCTIRDFQVWDKTKHRPGLLQANDIPYPFLSEETRSISQEVLEQVYQLHHDEQP